MSVEKHLKERLEELQKTLIEQTKNFDRMKAENERIQIAGRDLEVKNQQLEKDIKLFSRSQQAPQNVVFHSTIGLLEIFTIGEDWNLYQARLNQYFVANNIDENKKVATLITLIGPEAYKILRDLCDPNLPESKGYVELCDILKSQFAPKVSVFKERLEFYNQFQGENESINEWFARVKSKAINCKFGNYLNEIIKDKFVCGLRKGKIFDRVCEEEHTATLDNVVDVARKKEATFMFSKGQKQSAVYNIDAVKEKEKKSINKFKSKNNKDFKNEQKGSLPESLPVCNHCGGTRHNFSTCKYKSYKCKGCNKIGHLLKVCKFKSIVKDTNYLDHSITDNLSNNYIDMLNVVDDSSSKPMLLNLKINEIPLEVEADTGSGRSIMPFNIYKRLFSKLRLEDSSVKLRFYDGTIIKPEGEIKTQVIYESKVIDGTFIIVKKGIRILLGRDLLNKFNITLSNVNNIVTNDEDLNLILKEYDSLFEDTLGKYTGEKVHFNLKPNVTPIFIKPRQIPFALKEKVSKQLDKLEEIGIITKVNDSEWGTPLVPVLKPDGDIRICGDYKVTINKHIEDVKEPLPRIEEVFSDLSGGENFTKLDLTSAYNQLVVTDETKKLLAWSTHKGIYEVNRLTFGPKPAVAIFQRKMKQILQGCKGATSFLDDIVVTGKNKKEHLENLREVFKRLFKAGFKLNLKKCRFFEKAVKFLGHIISKEGLFMDKSKVAAIVDAPQPTNLTELQAFLGLVNYYRKFIPKMAEILSPLYNLTKKNCKFLWSEECEKAITEIKLQIVSDRNLVHFNPELPLKLVCDASNVGIGGVLSHIFPDGSDKPIAFVSRKLQEAEKKYAVIHKEALAIYWSVCKFYQYLMGNKFILCSDHKPLLALFGENKGIPTMAAGRLQRWALFLSGFSYKFEYIKGKNNEVADGLSRLPLRINSQDSEEVDYLHYICEEKVPISVDDIRKATRTDLLLSKVYRFCRDGWPNSVDDEIKPFFNRKTEISLDKDVIMWGYRIIIPHKFKNVLLKELHGAHIGVNKMKAVARQYFWWPKLDYDIEEFAKNCEACRKFAKKPEKTNLKKFEEPRRIFERVHMDFAGPFKGKTYLILIDAYSRWPEVFEMNKIDTSSTLEKLREVFSRFGLPEILFTDNGRQFLSEDFDSFCKNNGIEHRTSPPYHPETNGLAENMVGNFKNSLKKLLFENKENVCTMNRVNQFLATYRNAPHATTSETPAKRMLGRFPRTRLSFLFKDRIEEIREKQKKYFHGNRVTEFSEGEDVYMRDYKNPMKPIWSKAEIKKKLGDRTYLCSTPDQKDYFTKRHTDQLLKAGTFYNQDFEKIDIPENNEISMDKKLEEFKKKEESVTKVNTQESSSLESEKEEIISDVIIPEEIVSIVKERPKRLLKSIKDKDFVYY